MSFPGDGLNDILVSATSILYYVHQSAANVFAPSLQAFNTTATIFDYAVCDVDGETHPDVLLSIQSGSGSIELAFSAAPCTTPTCARVQGYLT